MAAWAAPSLVLSLWIALMLSRDGRLGGLAGAWLAARWQHLAHATGAASRPDFALSIEAGGFVVLGGILIFLLWRTRLVWAGLFAATALALLFYLSWLLYVLQHWAIDAISPGAGLIEYNTRFVDLVKPREFARVSP